MTPTEAMELVARLRHGYAGEATPEQAADAIEALARQLAEGPKVRVLEWEHISKTDTWQAESAFGEYAVGFDDGWWAQLDGPIYWDWEPPEDPRSYLGPEAAKAAAEADHRARVLAMLEGQA